MARPPSSMGAGGVCTGLYSFLCAVLCCALLYCFVFYFIVLYCRVDSRTSSSILRLPYCSHPAPTSLLTCFRYVTDLCTLSRARARVIFFAYLKDRFGIGFSIDVPVSADRRETKRKDAVDRRGSLSGALRALLSERRRGDHWLAICQLVRLRYARRSPAGNDSSERQRCVSCHSHFHCHRHCLSCLSYTVDVECH